MPVIAFDDRAMKRLGYPKPKAGDKVWCNPVPADEAHQTSMRLGSDALLKRLWERHHRVMLVAEACGRQVVRP